MKPRLRKTLETLAASAKSSACEFELLFLDEDFLIAEILLKPKTQASDSATREACDALERKLLKGAPEVQEVLFVREEQTHGTPETDVSKIRSGMTLTLDMLRSLEKAVQRDAEEKTLRQTKRAERFLTGPFHAWVEEAVDRMSSLPAGGGESKRLVPQLRETFKRLSRASRQISRLVEAERNSWGDLSKGLSQSALENRLPEILRSASREDYQGLLDILGELRSPLGVLDLESYLSVVDPAIEEAGEYKSPISVRLLNALFKDAMRRSARDIRIDPGASSALTQYRAGTEYYPVVELPLDVYEPLLGQVKKVAQMDVTLKRARQEGSIRFSRASQFGGLAVRALALPDRRGERIRLRLRSP
jgi:type II secretory ATPase GspE/PulE/Tfp pilus assembly ATPase PilB-like protein